jgi:AmiR/NasT family two-component response regulator
VASLTGNGAALEEQTLEYWRTRAAQLQTALETRIVIEQAKGVLRERYGLSIEDAFAALRSAARSAQLKLHAVATEVVASSETPDAVLHVLDRYRAS